MKAYGFADMAVELGVSCPRDGRFFSARQVRVVPNGIDVLSAAGNRQSVIGILRILYVGIHTETKGLFDLLETARELKQRGVAFEICTAGLWYTKEEQVRFEGCRAQWGLESAVQTLGQKTGADLWALYEWADVFFFPTFYPWETFGIVQLEAMATGLPVVASDWPGPKDVVLDGTTGFLCPAHDVRAFTDVMQKLAADRGLIRQLGAAGRARYKQFFTAECFIRNMKQIFNEVLS
jgi:glycosyltransferase involved in cell wall biosynthesis